MLFHRTMWSGQWPGPRARASNMKLFCGPGPGHNCCGPGPGLIIQFAARAKSAQLLRARAGPQIMFAGRAWISGPCRALVDWLAGLS